MLLMCFLLTENFIIRHSIKKPFKLALRFLGGKIYIDFYPKSAIIATIFADMAELADALDLGSNIL